MNGLLDALFGNKSPEERLYSKQALIELLDKISAEIAGVPNKTVECFHVTLGDTGRGPTIEIRAFGGKIDDLAKSEEKAREEFSEAMTTPSEDELRRMM